MDVLCFLIENIYVILKQEENGKKIKDYRRREWEERVKKYADAYDVEEVEIETDTIGNFDALSYDPDGEDNKGDY